jgi:hypothetical protein
MLANLSDDDVDLIANECHYYYAAKIAKSYKFLNEAGNNSPIDINKTDPESSPNNQNP